MIGFKDGVIMEIGNNTKFTECNYNLSDVNDVYYENYRKLFADAATI
jgi:hypothetical protein